MNDAPENSRFVIDFEESKELKKGEIERVKDEGINTTQDLMVFLEEQQTQAKQSLEKTAREIIGPGLDVSMQEAIRLALKESQDMVDHVVESTVTDITVASLRVACAKLSDIVGFYLEIDEDYIDDFGLTKRVEGQETKRTPGFVGYQEEQMERGTFYRAEGRLDAVMLRTWMKQLDVSLDDREAVLAGLRKHGAAEYREFSQSGPVLVLMPEMHYDAAILKNNFAALLEVKSFIAVLGSEGFPEREISQDDLGRPGTETAEFYRDKIERHDAPISSEAVEDVLGEEVYTLGLDRQETLQYFLANISAMMETPDPSKIAVISERLGAMPLNAVTKKDLIEYAKSALSSNGLTDLLVAYRNQRWLHGLQRFLLSGPRVNSSKNTAFLVCGAAHVDDLATQAQQFGFKGVILFTPHAFEGKVDPAVLEVYAEKQFGVPTSFKEEPIDITKLPGLLELKSAEGEEKAIGEIPGKSKESDSTRSALDILMKELEDDKNGPSTKNGE